MLKERISKEYWSIIGKEKGLRRLRGTLLM
jgi:hypothetical protein